MRVKLKLSNDFLLIEPVCELAYRLGLNSGLSREKATKLSLVIDELLTDIIQFAFEPGEVQNIDVSFVVSPSNVEVIVREQGEPFEPDLHSYRREEALKGNFEGAGLKVIQSLSDEFIFLNRGKAGKEYRILMNIEHPIVTGIFEEREILKEPEKGISYCIHPIGENDAEDISKLIYRTYRYSYPKEEMYYPDKVRSFIETGKKFGVIVRTNKGEAVGYFAVIRMPDSNIGEIGEAVVSPGHRGRGIMKMMINALIGMARERNLSGLFGEAVTVHTISQKVNYKFGFKSTALLLGMFPPSKIVGLKEDYPQRVSVIIDFLNLKPEGERKIYVPEKYRKITKQIYENLGIKATFGRKRKFQYSSRSRISLNINYPQGTALLVLKSYGKDFAERIKRKAMLLKEKELKSIYIDLPIEEPFTMEASKVLMNMGFILGGVMPLFHKEKDYLRLQYPLTNFDFSEIRVFSTMAKRLKRFIKREFNEVARDR